MKNPEFYTELKAQIERFVRLEPDPSKRKFTLDGINFTLEEMIDDLMSGTLPLYKLDLNDADRAFINQFQEELLNLEDMLDEYSPEGRLANRLYNQLRLAL
jgi:hypothetical protein